MPPPRPDRSASFRRKDGWELSASGKSWRFWPNPKKELNSLKNVNERHFVRTKRRQPGKTYLIPRSKTHVSLPNSRLALRMQLVGFHTSAVKNAQEAKRVE
jgi:hypothetical protein